MYPASFLYPDEDYSLPFTFTGTLNMQQDRRPITDLITELAEAAAHVLADVGEVLHVVPVRKSPVLGL